MVPLKNVRREDSRSELEVWRVRECCFCFSSGDDWMVYDERGA